MKKLNRKGFTLIELLAVIIIMAIILVVTVPNIITSINDARVSSLHNLAVSAAGTYDKLFAQDLIATTKTLGTIPDNITTTWKCLGSLSSGAAAVGGNRTLAAIMGLSATDLKLTGTVPPANLAQVKTSATCSAIRLTNGNAEVLLVANTGGKFFVAQKTTYALSTAAAGAQNAAG